MCDSSLSFGREGALATILLGMVLACAVSCSSRSGEQPLQQGPFLVADPNTVHLGEIGSLAPVTFNLQLQNRGTETVKITKIKSSCRCTSPLNKPMEMKSGQSALLPITYDPSHQKGQQKDKVFAFWNSPNHMGLVVDVLAEIKDSLSLSESVVRFERGQSAPPPRTVLIKSLENAPFRITKVTVPDYLHYEIPRNGDSLEHAVTFSLDPARAFDLGEHREKIVIETTDDRQSAIHLGSVVNVREALVADPMQLIFHDLEPGKPRDFSVLVSRRDGNPFRIAGVAKQSGGVALERIGDQLTSRCLVRGAVTAQAGKNVTDELTITGGDKEEIVKIPVAGFLR